MESERYGGGEGVTVMMVVGVDGGGLDGRRGRGVTEGGGYRLRLFWREASVMDFSKASPALRSSALRRALVGILSSGLFPKCALNRPVA